MLAYFSVIGCIFVSFADILVGFSDYSVGFYYSDDKSEFSRCARPCDSAVLMPVCLTAVFQESHQSVTVVLFQDEQTLVSSGSVDG